MTTDAYRFVSRFLVCALVCAMFFQSRVDAQATLPHEVAAQRFAVAADHPLASEAGLQMLRHGGNAVDAAVATSFCLAVVRPFSCGLGGGGFMLIYRPGEEGEPATMFAINYRETAPAAVGPEYYTTLNNPSASTYGPHSVGVPGTVAGLLWALDNLGTLDRATVLAPAIHAAEAGFPIDRAHVEAANEVQNVLQQHPHLREMARYVHQTLCFGGTAQSGNILRQPALAHALQLIAEHGADAFYRGLIAQEIVATMERYGGPMTADDLAGFQPRISAPLTGSFRGQRVLAMPPPSSGGVALIQSLGLIERAWSNVVSVPLPEQAWQFVDDRLAESPAYAHLLAESMKHAFADRAEHLADSRFVAVPVRMLTSEAYLEELASRIGPMTLNDRFRYGSVTRAAEPAPSDGGTSHLCVLDANGMAVACTETINLEFGSLLAVEEFGIVLNNEMDDFTTIPGAPNAFGLVQSDRNLPQPGKNPLSSMSPTIVLDHEGHVALIAGASGGPRIITATLQSLLRCMVFGESAGTAVAAPRIHHQWMPERLEIEQGWPIDGIDEAMKERGHTVERTDRGAAVQLIRVIHEGAIRAASDPRKGGKPAGD